jgi:hypothetical protein
VEKLLVDNMVNNIDFSDLGGTVAADFSDLGGSLAEQGQAQMQQAPTQQWQPPYEWGDRPAIQKFRESPFAQKVRSFMTKPRHVDSLIGALAKSTFIDLPTGMGDEMAKLYSGGHIAPKFGEGAVYDIGKPAGDILAYLSLEGLGGAAVPFVTGAPAIVGRLAGGGLYGAASAQEGDRLLGAGKGALISGVGEALPMAHFGLKKISDTIRPQKFVGALSSKIEDSLNIHEAKSSANYNSVFNRAGNSSIYGSPLKYKYEGEGLEKLAIPSGLPTQRLKKGAGQIEKGLSYTSLPQEQVRNAYKSKTLRDLHNRFIEDPTAKHAHQLQQSLGEKMRKMENLAITKHNGVLPGEDEYIYEGLKFARGLLKDDLSKGLKNIDPSLAEKYSGAQSYHRLNVVPHRNAYDAMLDLGESPSTEAVIDKFNRLKTKENKQQKYLGEGHRAIPEYLHEDLKSLEFKEASKKLAQLVGGGALGVGLTHGLGLPGATAGALIGGVTAPTLSNFLSKLKLPTKSLHEMLSAAGGIGGKVKPLIRPAFVTGVTNLLNSEE